MSALLTALDGAYNYYATTTGAEPILYYQYNGRGTIAVVPSTCGSGCGFLGFTGIEITNAKWNELYNGVLNDDEYDQIVFYEMGRNFYHYSDQLSYHSPDSTAVIPTGFAIYMRFKSMESIGVQGGPINGIPFETFKTNIRNLLGLYLANPSLNWDNTIRGDQGFTNPNGLGAADLIASMNMELEAQYGYTYTQNVWKEANKRPTSANTQKSVDNFIIAATCAVREPLTTTFSTWKYPISTAVLEASVNLTQTCGLGQYAVYLPIVIK